MAEAALRCPHCGVETDLKLSLEYTCLEAGDPSEDYVGRDDEIEVTAYCGSCGKQAFHRTYERHDWSGFEEAK